MEKVFRKCAGAVVFNKEGLVLLGNRADMKDDCWQFPQGGIEEGESPEEAAKRELFEETSVKSVVTVDMFKYPIRYEFTDDVKVKFSKRGIYNSGQDIYFVLFFFDGDDNEINVKTTHPEFKKTIWNTLDFAMDNIVDFKKDVYKKVCIDFNPKIKEYIKNLSQ